MQNDISTKKEKVLFRPEYLESAILVGYMVIPSYQSRDSYQIGDRMHYETRSGQRWVFEMTLRCEREPNGQRHYGKVWKRIE